MLCLLLLLTTAIIAQAADQEMIVAMKTGETHLSSDILESEHRWFQLQTASLSARYQYIANVAEIDASSRLQYQPVLSARFVFDGSGNYSIHAGVFPGQTFSAGWNQSGVGTGGAVTNVHVKQLYFEGKPFSGVEFQYGRT